MLPGCAGAASGTGISITAGVVTAGVVTEGVGAICGAGTIVAFGAVMVDRLFGPTPVVGVSVLSCDASAYPADIPNIAVVARPVARIFADVAGDGRLARLLGVEPGAADVAGVSNSGSFSISRHPRGRRGHHRRGHHRRVDIPLCMNRPVIGLQIRRIL